MEIKAIVIDDEKHSRETLKNLLEEFCPDIKILACLGNIKDSVQQIPLLKPDLVFLDIELQSGTGFDILAMLGEIDFEVVFTTAFDQYAIKAIKFSSLDYLLKPIDVEELQVAVEKAKKVRNKKPYNEQLFSLLKNIQQPKSSRICLATHDGMEFINIRDISHCEATGAYTLFKLVNGQKLLVSKHLKEYENLLTDHEFMRVHKSYLINLKEVKKFYRSDGSYILMNNNDTVSISRGKKESFVNAMQNIS